MKIYKTLPDGMQIVEYEDSLAQAVADMWNKSGEGWGGSFSGTVWSAGQVIAKSAVGSFFNIFIAMKDGEALGYCSFDRYTKDADTAYVHLLNVRPDHHGRKIGKELVLMCVNETIALGMPRVDIHTWPGNTKSVPLYKKCGFQWEDRSDTTHLCNFIPTVLSTGLFGGFFSKADWYADSSRKIEIKPDGIKKDKFEFFDYTWEKDGRSLLVGFEKTGRGIRLVETDDYRIEMTAENHELAFGLRYRCTFEVTNKSGEELDVAIDAVSDGVIRFEGSWAEQVYDSAVFEGTFFVGEISDAQDPMRMHPCVLADVRVNGKQARFGLGIEPKFPITISLAGQSKVSKPGAAGDVYINIKNNLPQDASVRFTLPGNKLTRFEQTKFDIKLSKGIDTTQTTRAHILECGYDCVPVTYDIAMDNGGDISFTRPLHLVNQGVNGRFGFETEEHHCAANGLWRLRLSKQGNTVNFERIVPSGFGEFPVSRLGKPYDDEFNIMQPSGVRVTHDGEFTRFEAEFASGKFAGAVLTEVFEFDAAGTLKVSHRVANNASSTLDLSLKAEFFTNIGNRPVFHYDGRIHELADDMSYGFDNIVQEKFDENWIFDSNADNPTGVFWPTQYKPVFAWGNDFQFEYPVGELAPGCSFVTEPVVFMSGVFKDYHGFRNYVLGLEEEDIPFAYNHLEVNANEGNPVLSEGNLALSVKNNRLKAWEGTVEVSSPDGLFAGESRDNLQGDMWVENAFNVPVTAGGSGIGITEFKLRFAGFEQDVRRALLVTDGSSIESSEQDGILTVTNDKLRFSVAPGFSDAVYSMRYNGNEWLYSRYPLLEPYSWWNPFVGGLKTFLERMGNSLVLRERISASFESKTDCFGNIWSGIRADVAIEDFDEYKGMRYSQYYMTLPGVPVMCHFTRLSNGTGRSFDAELYSMMYLSGKEGLTDLYASATTGQKTTYRLRMSGEEHNLLVDRFAAFSREGCSSRQEKLYVYMDSKRNRGKFSVEGDMNIVYCDLNMKGFVRDGGQYTTKPLFCIITEKDLDPESLGDLSRIEFHENY